MCICFICKMANETAPHLFYRCRVMLCVGRKVKYWLGLAALEMNRWGTVQNVKMWWTGMSRPNTVNRKAMASLTMIFQEKSTPRFYILKLIQEEAKLWVIAKAMHLSKIMPQE